jgi:hypothetical protein
MKKFNGQESGFRFRKLSVPQPKKRAKSKLVHYFKMSHVDSEDARDAKIADAAYEAYLHDPSGARPLDELIAEWEEMDAKQEKARK